MSTPFASSHRLIGYEDLLRTQAGPSPQGRIYYRIAVIMTFSTGLSDRQFGLDRMDDKILDANHGVKGGFAAA